MHQLSVYARIGAAGLAAIMAAVLTPSAATAAEGREGARAESPEERDRGDRSGPGLNRAARIELKETGMLSYSGDFRPVSSEPFNEDWVKHTFDTDDGDGPICIDGGEYSVFTRMADPKKLIFFTQGGGACWQDFARCNRTAEAQFPPPVEFLSGIFAQSSPDGTVDNPFADWSIVYLPYCDGSVFIGDNDVEEADGSIRRHRGLRNLSAGMEVARLTFRRPEQVLLTGSSAGGVGASVFTPFLARFIWGNHIDLTVFNDAGPVALDTSLVDAAAARLRDWGFERFFPQSCVDQGLCDPLGQQTGLIQWRLQNDSTIREAFYETDGDLTNIGFASSNVPGNPAFFPISQFDYRQILDREHGAVNAAFPDRYKRFVVSGGNPLCFGFVAYTHTALQGGNLRSFGCSEEDIYFELSADGVPLNQWTEDFIANSDGWVDIVEPFVPAPPLPQP